MSENLDIKDISLLTTVSDTDRILMTKASGNHTAAALTVADLKSKVVAGSFLKKTGDTMTGILKVMDGGAVDTGGVQTTNGYGLVMYKGTTQTTLGMPLGTTLIRSGAANLVHVKAGTSYTIWDSSNSNLTSVPWKASSLALAGAITGATSGTFSGNVTANRLIISSNTASAHITFTRPSANYFTAPASGYFIFQPNGGAIGSPGSPLVIHASGIYPGTTNTKSVGLSTHRWSNVYSVLGNFSGALTVSGNITCAGEVISNSASDIRLKTNAQKLTASNLLRQVNAYSFDWTDEGMTLKGIDQRHDEGFIAQEIKAIAPHFTTDNLWGKGYLGIDKSKFIPYLVAGWNEHDTRISVLEEENRKLSKELQLLKEKLY